MKQLMIQCPNCENEFTINSSAVGKQIKCPTCKNEFWAKKSLVVIKANKVTSFLCGLLFGPLGILIGYICYKKEGAIWAAVGFCIWLFWLAGIR